MSDDREPIIDALLEEVLGDQQPPDLTQRILGAYDAATDSSIDVGRVRPIGNGTSTGSTSNGRSKLNSVRAKKRDIDEDEVAPQIKADEHRKAAKSSSLQTWASVAVVLIGAGGFLYWATTTGQDHNKVINGPNIVKHHPRVENDNQFANVPNVVEDETVNQEEYIPPGTKVDLEPSVFPNDTQITLTPKSDETELDNQPTVPESSTDIELAVDPFASPIYVRALQIGEGESDARMINTIDDQLSKKWELTSFEPTREVDDRQWFYRATNFLLGRPPKEGELRSFARSLDREGAVDQMLASSEFGRRWALFYTHVLTGATTSKDHDKRELAKYLASSINEGKPYDQLAFELITAAGSSQPDNPDFNPASNFLLANPQIEWVNGKKREQHKLQATERVSQIFLGRQLQCARCHDYEGTTQDQYYRMVSFFTQLHPMETDGVAKLKNADYLGGADRNIDEADVYFTRRKPGSESDGTGVSVYPTFLDGREAPTMSGRLRDINRREVLAKFVVSSEDFPRAFVNRIWSEALGYGFTNPIEDMGSHNPPSHPELLQSLSEQFKNSGYDIKPMMKWIALSRPFKLQSRANTDMFVRRPDMFSSFARTDHDLMYLSLSGAMNESSRALREGVVPDAHAQIGMEKEQKMSATQRSRLQASLNAKKDFLKERYGSVLAELARNEELSDLDRVNHVFLMTVGRLAVQYERDRGIEILEMKKNNPESALQEIGVLILNSKEFATQH